MSWNSATVMHFEEYIEYEDGSKNGSARTDVVRSYS